MALITDPDLLNQGTEVTISTGAKTVALAVAGNLSTDGVTGKALYSFLKEEWRADSALIKFDFPMTPITDESMQIGVSSRNNGWNFANATTRELLRTVGWQEVNSSGVVTAEYAGIVSLGSLVAGTQVYYQQVSGGATTNFVLTDAVNQAVKVFENGSFDYRSYFKLFAREQGDTYAVSQLSDIGVTTMTYQVYRFPLATGADNKITVADTGIDANSDDTADVSPYSGMSITYYASAQSRTIDGVSYNFGVIIDGNNGTAEQIYQFVQWSLRRTIDIDAGAGSLIGKIADELLRFTGDNLATLSVTNPAGGGSGVYIDNFQSVDTTRLSFKDNTGATIVYNYVANLTLGFSATLQGDSNAKFWAFFTNDDAGANAGNDFNTSGAILVATANAVASASRSRASNVATINTGAAHGLTTGDLVTITGMGGTGYNATAVEVTVVDTDTFTYANSGTDEGNTADTGGTVTQLIAGNVGGNTSRQFTFAYDTNVQRGSGSDGVDAPITVVAIGLSGAQYVLTEGTLQRTTANAVSLVAPTERNYANP